MNINQVNTILTDKYEGVYEVVKQAFSQLFGREVSVSQSISDETNTIISISEGDYPKLHISFTTNTSNVFKHLLIMDPQFGLNLFAWMIGDEPESEIGDEHIEFLNMCFYG